MAVRRESVQLDVTGNFVGEVAAAAAGVAALRMQLDSLGRVRINTNINQSFAQIDQGARRADGSINQLSGRLRLMADGLLALGPGLVPIAATGTLALGGLAAAVAGVAVSGAAVVVAFQGVGDGLKAMNDYAIEPTADNFNKMQAAMRNIAPEAQTFVRAFQEFRPVLRDIRDASAAGLFPGLTESLADFERLAPLIEDIFGQASAEFGAIVADSADSFDSKRWRPFLKFVADEVPAAMRSVSNIVGDITRGMAMMWRSFDPANDDVLGWLEDVAKGFDKWASSSEGRDDIAAFIEYARENGPEVREMFAALGDALGALVSAAAPLGGPVLESLTAVLNVFTALANSDLGTPILAAVAALTLLRRGMALTATMSARMGTTGVFAAGVAAARTPRPAPGFIGPATPAQAARGPALVAGGAGLAKTAALIGALTIATTGLGESTGLTNTATLGLLGTLGGPLGAAAGAAAGFTLDLVSANNQLQDSIKNAEAATTRDPIETLLARREQLVDDFVAVTNGGGLAGAQARIAASLSNDDEKTLRAVANIDALIAAKRELNSLDKVSPLDGLNDLFGDLNGEIAVTTSLVNDFVGALARADGFLSKRGAVRAYEEALDGVGAALKKNGKTLDATTAKGRANQKALDGIADAGLRLAENLKGARKARFLDGLESDLRKVAQQFGLTGKPLRNFLNQLGLIDKKKVAPKLEIDDKGFRGKYKRAKQELNTLDNDEANPFVNLFDDPFRAKERRVTADLKRLDVSDANPGVDANADPFYNTVGGVRATLNALDGDTATTYVRTIFTSSGSPGGLGRGAQPSADGGTVPTSGQPYADRYPYLLADGEEVISNRYGQADRNRDLLKAINAGRLADGGTAGRLASGGTAGASGAAETARDVRDLGKEAKKAAAQMKEQRRERQAYASEVKGSLAGELTGGGLAQFDLANNANRNDARTALKALKRARDKGLSGSLLNLVAASGDLSLIQQFAELNRGEIRRREERFGATRAAENALGNFAARERFDRDPKGRKGRRGRSDADAVRDAVRDGAREGTAAGASRAARGRRRDAATRGRAGR